MAVLERTVETVLGVPVTKPRTKLLPGSPQVEVLWASVGPLNAQAYLGNGVYQMYWISLLYSKKTPFEANGHSHRRPRGILGEPFDLFVR